MRSFTPSAKAGVSSVVQSVPDPYSSGVPAGADAGIAELVGRARNGDREAFAEIVKRLKERAIRTAYHLTGNWSDAEDVAQEAFLRAYRGLASFDGRSELST